MAEDKFNRVLPNIREKDLQGPNRKTLEDINTSIATAVAALLTGTILAAGTNIIGSVKDEFGGNTYSKTMTMTDDNATRFEASAKKLRDAVIIVETHPMLLGETGVEVYPMAATDRLGFTKIDISTLYFKNAGAGNNGKITILGVEE